MSLDLLLPKIFSPFFSDLTQWTRMRSAICSEKTAVHTKFLFFSDLALHLQRQSNCHRSWTEEITKCQKSFDWLQGTLFLMANIFLCILVSPCADWGWWKTLKDTMTLDDILCLSFTFFVRCVRLLFKLDELHILQNSGNGVCYKGCHAEFLAFLLGGSGVGFTNQHLKTWRKRTPNWNSVCLDIFLNGCVNIFCWLTNSIAKTVGHFGKHLTVDILFFGGGFICLSIF